MQIIKHKRRNPNFVLDFIRGKWESIFQSRKTGYAILLGIAMLLGGTLTSHAQINYATAGSSYTQNFDGLYTTVPSNNTTQAASLLPSGWQFVETGANANTTFRNDNGSSGTGDTYLVGTTASNERALGSFASGSLVSQFGASFVNNSGVTLNEFTLTYTGEQWKDGGSGSSILNKLTFAYAINPTSLTVGTFVNVPNLDFTALVNNNTSDVTTDGNASNRRSTITFTVTGLTWQSGETLILRWSDNNDAGNDDNLAVDDLTFSATTSTSPTILTFGSPAAVNTTYGTPSASPSSFAVEGNNLTNDIVITAPNGFEVSTNSSSGYALMVNLTPSSNTVTNTTIFVRLTSIANVAGSPYSGNIDCSSSGANSVAVSTTSSTVSPLSVSTSGALASDKVYDGNTDAAITGATVVGAVNGDALTLSGGGIFASSQVGTSVAVTGSLVVNGTNASSYSLTQPVFSASITEAPLTISGLTADNKTFDGTTTATLSGTPVLNGVIAIDNGNVTLTGTPVADFISAAVGTNIPVVVSGYSIAGSAASNYALSQPTGLFASITTSPTPVITSSLTANATYGANTSYFITATNGPTIFNATGLPAGLTVDTSTGEISGIPLDVAGSPFTISISATNVGGTGSAQLLLTVLPASLTIMNATAQDKIYDRTTDAVVTGSLSGIIGSDMVTFNGVGSFSQFTVGTLLAVTAFITLSGVDANKYTIVQPTNLTASISPLGLTISNAIANNKPFDGTTTATLTGTLAGVINPDVVSLNLSGDFAQSAVGNNIAVTSTSSIADIDAANYFLIQPTGLTANITPVTNLTAGDIAVIGYNTNGTPDNIALLVLTDLYPGTVFYVNDNEVNTAGGISFTDLNEGEASFTVNPGQTILAGTVLTLPWGSAAVTTTQYTWSSTSSFGLGNNNEEIYIYTANAITSNTPTTFIYFAKIGSSSSSIPNGLTLGTTAIATSGTSLRYNTTGALYTGCKPVLLSAIGATTSNWTTTGATTINAADWTFTVLPTCPTPTLSTTGNPNAMNSTYGTPSSVDSFTVSGVDLSSVITVTSPAGFEVSVDNLLFTSSITLTPTNGTVNSTTLYVRLNGFTPVANSPYAGDIACTSTGAVTQLVALPSSVLLPKDVTITGLQADNKVFDGTTTATLSGVPLLNGVLTADIPDVVLGGTAVANFASSALGVGISVTVTGYTLTGSAATNYDLIQPTGLSADITSSPTPVITSPTTATAVYGSFASVYTITATNAPTSFNATGLPPGLTINTVTGEITGTPTSLLGSPYTVTISATNAGGTGSTVLLYTIQKATLTIAGGVGTNKVYDRTTQATFTGNLVGVFGTDLVSLNGNGTFAQFMVGTGIAITSNATLAGPDAGNYDLIQPTGLFADITPFALTIANANAASKQFDGTNTATISGSLAGVISPDVVSLTLSGTFATSAVGLNIPVTSTSIIGGLDVANYTLTQPSGLTANIVDIPTLTEIILPQFIQGVNGTNANRIPFAYRVKINNLIPQSTYRYTNQVVIAADLATANGAGNMIFANPSGFVRTASPGFTTAGNYGTFTSDNNGEYTGWFITEPTGNATRFVPGTNLFMRIALNDGNNGTTVVSRVTTTQSVQVMNLVASSGANNGTAVYGNSLAIAKNFIFSYDNESGTGRPLSGSFVESDGSANTTVNSYASFYGNNVDAISGAYGFITPNINPNGIRRIEQYDLLTAALIGCAKDSDGVWPSGANTVSPTGGTTAIALTSTDAPLDVCCVAPTIVSVTPATTICSGDTLSLQVNASGSGPLVYAWSGLGTIQNVDSATTIVPGATTSIYTVTVSNSCGSTSSTVDVIATNCSATLNLTTFIQGYYIGSGTMNSVLVNQGSTTASMDDCDEITVELHEENSPFGMVHSFTGILQTNGTLSCTYPASVIGQNYYIVVKHRSALETWSGLPITFSNTTTYDFSTSSSQAYGNNLIEAEPGVWTLYSGDITADYAIDGLDYVLLDPDVIAGAFGNVNTDLTGDGIVDAFDYLILDPNIIFGITAITP